MIAANSMCRFCVGKISTTQRSNGARRQAVTMEMKKFAIFRDNCFLWGRLPVSRGKMKKYISQKKTFSNILAPGRSHHPSSSVEAVVLRGTQHHRNFLGECTLE